jgi:hypothetical protein
VAKFTRTPFSFGQKKLRSETESAGTPSGHDDFYKSYVLFVDLVQKKIIGGARFTASKAR